MKKIVYILILMSYSLIGQTQLEVEISIESGISKEIAIKAIENGNSNGIMSEPIPLSFFQVSQKKVHAKYDSFNKKVIKISEQSLAIKTDYNLIWKSFLGLIIILLSLFMIYKEENMNKYVKIFFILLSLIAGFSGIYLFCTIAGVIMNVVIVAIVAITVFITKKIYGTAVPVKN